MGLLVSFRGSLALQFGLMKSFQTVSQDGFSETQQASDHTRLPWTLSTVRSRTLQRKEGNIVLLLPPLPCEGVKLL